jgi:predicted dienelactone hydrolase
MRNPFSAVCLVLSFGTSLFAEPAIYDPLKVDAVEIVSKTFTVHDAARHRDLPIRVYLPRAEKPVPVILFSHGLGGSCDNNPYLGNHWAGRGYVVVFVQHPGSDEGVWKDKAPGQRMTALKQAASMENFMSRSKDIPAVIDALTLWNKDEKHPLHDRMDLKHIGMSGHSFGAKTTQSAAGQSAGSGLVSAAELRISAAVMMSPGPPSMGDPAKAFGSIKVPCLLMTGTLDVSPIGNTSAEDRLKVFPYLTNAPAWQVVFDKGTHMSFGDRDLKGASENGNRYHKSILALTTAFWDTELNGSAAAKDWLNGKAARTVLFPEDKWEMNAKATGKP